MTHTTAAQRSAIEAMRYELGMIERERRRADAAESFEWKLKQEMLPPLNLKGNIFTRMFRPESGPCKEASYELDSEERQLLVDFLRDQAHRRRLHADALEIKIAVGKR